MQWIRLPQSQTLKSHLAPHIPSTSIRSCPTDTKAGTLSPSMNWLFGRQQTRQPRRSSTPESVLTRQPTEISPSSHQIRQDLFRFRVYFGISGATAVGRPSSGGILTLSVNAVDLDFLSVSRLEPTRVPELEELAADEAAWCTKLRQLAPKWGVVYRIATML